MSSAIGFLLCSLARTSKKVLISLFSILTLLLSFNTLAANGPDNAGRADYDLDDNGLIEINDLADLDEIRNNLDGKALYGSSVGCPNAEDGTVNGGCKGFELTADLDFDTNGNGVVDDEDGYRNITQEGIARGWEPIGDGYPNYFTAHFNGNGYVIKNLTINRPSTFYVGLFGLVKDSTIESVVIAGLNSEVIGKNYVAALVGYAQSNTHIRNVVVVASVQGEDYVAGLVGWANSETHIENSFVSGSVSGNRYIAGLVAYSFGSNGNSKNTINQSLSTSFVVGNSRVGGLIGSSYNTNTMNSYWAKDTSGQDSSAGRSEANSYVGLDLVTLQCATAGNTDFTTGCISANGSDEGLSGPVVLYKDWDSAIWDFGIAPNANQQLPGLKFNGQVLRDGDGDGILDADDVWPNNYAASKDLDADGYPDAWSQGCDDACIVASGLTLDQFPYHDWAALDADFDGLPDDVVNCESDCQLGGLTKDGALGDYDNDGILDAVDSDEDNDGIDDIDANHNGLIDIDSLEKLNAMRFQLQGVGLQLTDISDVNSSGCPRVIYQGTYQQRCSGYELTQDLDFDSNTDGIVDEYDDYRNINSEGIAEGWEPIGTSSGNSFSAMFNGNGHVIKNLTINRPATIFVGLFGWVENAVIENVAIAGLNSEVIGKNYVAALVGYAQSNTHIRNVVVAANVHGEDKVAGLVGQVNLETHIENSFVSGSVSGDRYVAGLVGWLFGSSNSRSSISQSLSISSISGNSSTGGLVGIRHNTDIVNSYWAKDASGKSGSSGSSAANSYVGLSLTKLQCAIAENTGSSTGCVSVDGSGEGLNAAMILYKGWDPAIWDFGIAPNANQQLPGLKFNGQVLRDGDGDGILDADDVWPNNYAASKDLDADGYPDAWSQGCDDACIVASGLTLDQFPYHDWAALDADFDGLPDDVVNCESDCQLGGLTKDGALGDYDNDGILDAVDSDEDNDGIDDIDANHNGLIDIDSLEKLNAMRFQLQGVGLQLTATSDIELSGCPWVIYQGIYQQQCSGYELTQDLDFDSNTDGIVDEYDDYRNINSEGIAEGWEPVGTSSNYFGAIFNGNEYVIKNLTINRPETNYIGLFGMVKNAVIENMAIAGPSSEIVGRDSVAALVGYAWENTLIRNVVITANVEGADSVSGLVGQINGGAHIENCFVSGSVSGDSYVAGLVGQSFGASNSKNSISQSLSTSFVMGNSSVGGLIGYSYNTNNINSYWAKDVSEQNNSFGSSEVRSYVGLNLWTLQCAIAENTDSTTDCVSGDGSAEGLTAAVVLYKDWDPAIWDFGTSEQLPGLKFNSQVLRDSDGDGVLDADDKWPNNRAASKDLDADGYPDAWSLGCDDTCIVASSLVLDQFPHHAWAALDADFDGLPDGAENCVSDCQLDGLTKDGALGDYDNDGTLDAVDADEYGVLKVDMDGDGLIDIDSLDKLNAMRFQLQGVGLQLTDISDVDMSGCPFIIYQGIYQQRCSGYELTRDLDFDTNDNGEFDSQDAYWNENSEGIGEGWLPVGGYYDNEDYFFEARFNGNGHVINNLTINRPGANNVGLFGVVNNSYIENLAIGGLLTEVVGYENVGALAGVSIHSEILNISVAARIQSQYFAGGLAGSARRSSYKNIFVSGSVTGEEDIGGLSGEFLSGSINNIVSNSVVGGDEDTGGLVGDSNSEAIIRNSYWAIDTSTQSESHRSSEADSYVGLPLAKLQCAITENTDFTSGCVSENGLEEGLDGPVILYKDWDPVIWDFGTAPSADEQLPALKINGRIFRDSDADGIFDSKDAFPLNLAAAIDDDNDGMPDFWNPRCDEQCQTDSGLVIDPFLNDTDNDGVENDFIPEEEEPVVEEPPVVEPPITEPPVTEPPANPSPDAEASSGGSSGGGGGAMAWMLLLLMTLAVAGQYRRYAKTEKNLF